jgi:hypothetical protein
MHNLRNMHCDPGAFVACGRLLVSVVLAVWLPWPADGYWMHKPSCCIQGLALGWPLEWVWVTHGMLLAVAPVKLQSRPHCRDAVPTHRPT